MNTSDRYEDRYTDPEPGTDPKPMTVGDLRKLLDGVPDHLEVMGEVEFNNGDSYVIGVVRTVEVETRCDDIPVLYIWTNANDHTVEDEDEEEILIGPGAILTDSGKNPITALMEYAQAKHTKHPQFQFDLAGPPHVPVVQCMCRFGDLHATATATTKKEAKTKAAADIVKQLIELAHAKESE